MILFLFFFSPISPFFFLLFFLLNFFISSLLHFSPPHLLPSYPFTSQSPSPACIRLPAACARPPAPWRSRAELAGRRHGGSPPTSPPSSPHRSIFPIFSPPAASSAPQPLLPPASPVRRCLPRAPPGGSFGKGQGEAGKDALLLLHPS
jgi:hypothetical protein